MFVYVAASSKELERVKWAIRRLEDGGAVVTHDWASAISNTKIPANPITTEATRKKFATEDLDGVLRANYVLLLLGNPLSPGAFFECGFAYSLGIPIVVAGANKYDSIFTSLAKRSFAHDTVAIKWILRRKVLVPKYESSKIAAVKRKNLRQRADAMMVAYEQRRIHAKR